MKVTFDHSEPQVSNIISFYFKPERPVKYTAGQFIQLRLPHDNRDNRGDKRWFTLSSSPTEELLTITTKFATENGSTFKQTLRNLQPGTVVDMAEPMGDFVLTKDPSIPLVFVAGGIGLTPFRSQAKWLLDTGEQLNIHLLYSLGRAEEMVFQDTFKALGIKIDVIVANPPEGWTGLSGQLTAERILEITGSIDGKLIYMSGPEPMVETFDKGLRDLGVNKKQLIGDFFPGYAEV